MSLSPLGRTALVFVIATAITLVSLTLSFRLWEADLDVPFEYTVGGDVFLFSMVLKAIDERGTIELNPALGAPGVQDLRAFPAFSATRVLWVRVLANLVDGFGRIANCYTLADYFLATWAALLVLRKLGISDPVAVVTAVLYAFLPYHCYRGQEHLFLSTYFIVPLVVLLAVRVGSAQPLFPWPSGRPVTPEGAASAASRCFAPIGTLRPADLALTLVTVVLISASNAYYAFFAVFFFAVAGLVAYGRTRRVRQVGDAVVLAVVVSAFFMAQRGGRMTGGVTKGSLRGVGTRSYVQAEIYALRLSALLVPNPGHRFYGHNEPWKGLLFMNENRFSYLGVFGAVGFLALVTRLFMDRRRRQSAGTRQVTISVLARLNLAALLLAVPAGFGLAVARLISPQIRAYNRISVYIAFFAFATTALGIDAALRRLTGRRSGPLITGLLLGLVLIVGLVDQVPVSLIPDHARERDTFDADHRFVKAIEAKLPAETMVFQIPHLPFPEGGEQGLPHRMIDYDPLRGYLHSRHLRWSYGIIKGSDIDLWQKRVATEPPARMLKSLRRAGFQGLWIDRFGYSAADASRIEAVVAAKTEHSPIVSENGRFVFFDLRTQRGSGTPLSSSHRGE